ncbi:MAG: peptide chain release factor N(5)-glutamine methyltransferase [Mariniblastus sp.]|nr:peptide chain release factor N(5)-glutamine methyltransferase [Mariniblastus sp.]
MNDSKQENLSSEEQPWTIQRLLDWTTEHFGKRDPDNPRLRAEVLLAEALRCERIELYTRFDTIPPADSLDTFRDWVKRHARGEPVAYIVGSKEFYSLRFRVDPHVLIPRPETEHVIIEALESAKAMPRSPLNIVDMGTGSGCIAITLAKHLSQSSIWGVDVSPDALGVARDNAETHALGDAVQWMESDLFERFPDDLRFDLIVSNPPYIGTSEQGTVDTSVVDFEPHVALFGGVEGMDIIQRLAVAAADRLVEGGVLIFEMSPMIESRCRAVLDKTPGLNCVKTVNDYAGLPRVMVARRTG